MKSEKDTLGALEARVDRLERQNRLLKRIGFLSFLVLSAVFLMGQGKPKPLPPKVIKSMEAGKFIVKDGRGVTRAEFGLFAEKPALVFYDSAQNATLSLGFEEDGTGLTLFDRNGQTAAALTFGPNGPLLALCQRGTKRLNLSVTAQGPALGLVGRNGEAKAALALTADDNPFLHLFGIKERGGAQLSAAPDRTVLRFFDASDRARAVFGILEKESAPGLVLNDGAGVARAIFMLTSDEPGLEFFDQNRVRIWTAR